MRGAGAAGCTTLITATTLNTVEPLRRTALNRVFAVIYTCAIFALFYHHAQTLLHCKTLVSFSISLLLLLSDIVLVFMWITAQSFRMRPVHRREYPESLKKSMKHNEFPALDVFICTADPYKEPPVGVVNTALSVMAYDYPTEKVSIYVSDDGGSVLTLFAFTEAAKFASHWLPFCRENDVIERNPDAYFASNHFDSSETHENIKTMYEDMKVKVKHVVEAGKISDEYITSDQEREAFDKWTDGFILQDHPTVIQILLENDKDKDITGNFLPNLIYVSREKSKTSHHYFKAGALNVLLRVSATMTNAPIVLTLDCDMYSNDPQTPLRALCYISDPALQPNLAYVQFPQLFYGLNKHDIYASEFKRMFQLNFLGLDGLRGPHYHGTGTFFCRRALFGGPSTLISPEIAELSPHHAVKESIKSPYILSLAHRVAGCNYENQTNWGSKIGLRYGSLVEDYYTGYHLHCEGWRSVFCHPKRPAFYGNAPTNLLDMLNQNKRWAIGFLEVAFSKYSPLTFGISNVGLIMGLGYAHLAFLPSWPIPITVYGFLPQLALLNGVSIFPKVSEPWFFLYLFMFLGAYGQDFLDFVLEGGTFRRWWNDQRLWQIRGLSCFLFGFTEYLLNSLGIHTFGFNVTSKVPDDELRNRYDQEIFEFGAPSPMFVPMTTAAMLNFFSFLWGFLQIICGVNNMQGLLLQLLLSGFVMVNCWPIYGAIILRSDKGKMPAKVTIVAAFLAWALYTATCLIFKR